MNNTFYIKDYSIFRQTESGKLPDIDFLPALFRRRLTNIEKIGFFLIHALKECPSDINVVFASRFGEWRQTFDLIFQLENDEEMSPAGFSHSVHNAMPGLFSVLKKNIKGYTTVSAKEYTIDTALTETFISGERVLFIYAEEETPDFYKTEFENSFLGHGTAFILSLNEEKNSRKIEVQNSFHKKDPISFEELINFLEKGGELITNHLTIRSLK